MSPPVAPVDPLTGLEAARLTAYVHFPFCLSKCPYCDFASIASSAPPAERYTRALLAELSQRFPQGAPRFDAVYFGGGTPSLWPAAGVDQVLSRLPVAPGAEITLEANPGAADAARFRDYRSIGVNRLSIGVQSFEPSTLAALGRAHDGAAAVRAFEAARAAGFSNVSLDFIYGVHGQTLDQARSDARRAAELEPEHLSAYALTLEREALAEEVPLARQLSRGEVTLPDDEQVIRMRQEVAAAYALKGLQRYEISNYARPGYHSRHNAAYWTGGEYLGLGAGATGRLGSLRYQNHRSAERYFSDVESGKAPIHHREELSPQILTNERLVMGLRLTSGVRAPADAQVVARLERAGLLAAGERLTLTERGLDLHSSVSSALMA